ncbi:MAG: transketolase [Spirochaetae bacterium HGW-Spirochaetae-6]|nr:MAG: transketolase [Spirochaetae bacterium HGW-Spirochaetae-6]
MKPSLLEQKCNFLRNLIIESVFNAGSGHPGGSLSAVELMVVLYEKFMKFDPQVPSWNERDYMVLSKGHAAPLIYGILSMYGYIPKEELSTLRKLGSRLQGHPDATKLPGIEVSTGSPGQGFGVAAGIALGIKTKGQANNVFTLLGDGELQEGTVWETAMAASHYKLSRLCAIVDANGFQIDGKVEDVMNVNPIGDKFKSFGWKVKEFDGHNLDEVEAAFQFFMDNKSDKPVLLLAHTIKGKGVSFMQNTHAWHGKAPSAEEFKSAQDELKLI